MSPKGWRVADSFFIECQVSGTTPRTGLAACYSLSSVVATNVIPGGGLTSPASWNSALTHCRIGRDDMLADN